MRIRTAILGGFFDSGFAASAAFASSVYASRFLETSALGYYSLFLTGFLAASTVPGRLLFFPYEVAAVARGPGQHLAFVRRAIFKGSPLALGAAVISASVAGFLARGAGMATIVALGVSMAAAAVLSPLQDHVRRILHVDGRSGLAALVSSIQLLAVLAAILTFHRVGIGTLWIPYLALTVANAASLLSGLLIVRRIRVGPEQDPPPFRSIARSGSWLLYISLLGPIVGMAVNAMIIEIAGADTLGFAEAARQAARPLLVVTTGLGMALRPRSFAAAQRLDRTRARRIEVLAVAVTVAVGLAYTGLVSVDWPLNFMEVLIPKAYEVQWLVLAVCISNIVVGVAFPSGYELIGGGKEGSSAATETVGQGLRLLTAALAGILGSFTIAVSDTAMGIARIVGYRIGVRSLYRASPPGAQRGARGG